MQAAVLCAIGVAVGGLSAIVQHYWPSPCARRFIKRRLGKAD